MIDSNNSLRKLSKGLIDSVRGIMESKSEGTTPKTEKEKDLAAKAPPHDKITHADVLAGRGVLKKHPTTGKMVTKEESEQIDELSIDKLRAYRAKAREDAYDADDVDDERRFRKRAAGSNTAGKKIVKKGGSLKTEEVEELDEALDAAARYGQHHTAVKELMKSISQHIDNHKNDALKHRDYRGKKGVNWGHVGDIAQVHSQLADIHDRLAQQGEYKKAMAESVEELDIEQIDELSKSTLASYVKKAIPSQRGLEDASDRAHQKGHDAYTAGATKTSDKLLTLSQRHLEKAGKRGTGINRAVDKLAKEEVEQVDEISAKTVDSYREKAYAQQPAGDDGSNLYKKRKAGRDMAFKKVTHGAKVPATNEEVELTQEELDAIENIANGLDLDEARGRPRKNPLPAGQEPGEEPRQHIIQQLQRAKLSMQGGAKVKFKDGSEHDIHGKHASKLLDKYAGMKPHEKEAFQKKIGASHEGLKSEL